MSISFEYFDPETELGTLDENGRPTRPRKKPGRKPNPPSPAQRKAQNRAAQRAFRERKHREIKDAEATIKRCAQARDEALRETRRLKRKTKALLYELNYLKGIILTFKIICLANNIDVPKIGCTGQTDEFGTEILCFSKTPDIPQALELYLDDKGHIISFPTDEFSLYQPTATTMTATTATETTATTATMSPDCNLTRGFNSVSSPSSRTCSSSSRSESNPHDDTATMTAASIISTPKLCFDLNSIGELHNQFQSQAYENQHQYPHPHQHQYEYQQHLQEQHKQHNQQHNQQQYPQYPQQQDQDQDQDQDQEQHNHQPLLTVQQFPHLTGPSFLQRLLEADIIQDPNYLTTFHDSFSGFYPEADFDEYFGQQLFGSDMVIEGEGEGECENDGGEKIGEGDGDELPEIDARTGLPRITTEPTPDPPVFHGKKMLPPMTPMQALDYLRVQKNIDKGGRTLFTPKLQRTIPHDTRIDLVPGSEMRDHMIMFQDYYDANELFDYLVESAMFLGGEMGNPDCWFVSPQFLGQYWFLCPNHTPQRMDNAVEIMRMLGQRMMSMMMERKEMLMSPHCKNGLNTPRTTPTTTAAAVRSTILKPTATMSTSRTARMSR
ncbi:basic-leucine zipper transcription factor [Phycomyces blakesleeanus NRRL 1555(-)]|uniref:Basic-leucine zipper transcription factor n=1 Tax=Phycomyces blakesleeanus (strain ATCC 8743b / DSM 1359 / FGSC 10004 / NBRC 33097 / NRRL 1555) TaxID=763407 RepID=A0A162XJF1_PHYB8|nr:basic-leucine zipper transcription factor [Phycomyces blakesleeanus NRRL 1555(-)]OAD75295.1 basic-leucine zipper transcription factor [Phycomyces blakesleeanus NRRL 1555(-)]|eukprot:XP_018293335.1 basic-leucine zipper transcription factor [Phycomyces blakesleeanus NRRL 1555(-)]